MRKIWPDGFARVPDQEWATAPIGELALKYDTVEDHGWYRNLDKTVEDVARFVESGYIVADYSGGTGILAGRLIEEVEIRDFGILIVDSSPKFLRLALEKLGRHERMGFRHIRYIKNEQRLQMIDEVMGDAMLARGLDAIISTNAIHLYYGLDETLASWRRVLRPGARVFIQSGNIGVQQMPDSHWIIDETVAAIDERAREIAQLVPEFALFRDVLEDEERMSKHQALREKFFLPVRPLSYYVDTLESAGLDVVEVSHRPIQAHVDQWFEFLSAYHEGVLGWAGGSRRVEGYEPDEETVAMRLSLMRHAMNEVFEGAPSFMATWTYITAEPRSIS